MEVRGDLGGDFLKEELPLGISSGVSRHSFPHQLRGRRSNSSEEQFHGPRRRFKFPRETPSTTF